MKKIFFAIPGNDAFTDNLVRLSGAEKGEAEMSHFPDGETYVRLHSDVSGKTVCLVANLMDPDPKIVLLHFLSQLVKEKGAAKVVLIAPYLAYMRQDIAFKQGEGPTAQYFAGLLSFIADELVTIDPHLHRIENLNDVYSIPAKTLHASPLIADWIRENVEKPVLIGPDVESKQWVSDVAEKAGCPFLILEKLRHSAKEVEVSDPEVDAYPEHQPVLVDDIISTAGTMMETAGKLRLSGMKLPVCIGIHGLFTGDAYEQLKAKGVTDIVTCNTIPHVTNRIEVEPLILQALG